MCVYLWKNLCIFGLSCGTTHLQKYLKIGLRQEMLGVKCAWRWNHHISMSSTTKRKIFSWLSVPQPQAITCSPSILINHNTHRHQVHGCVSDTIANAQLNSLCTGEPCCVLTRYFLVWDQAKLCERSIYTYTVYNKSSAES